jgi:hypothetical protein
MKYIYILENEEKFRDEMIEAIRKIDPQLLVRYFTSLEEFSKWIKRVMVEGSEALTKGGSAPAGQLEPTEGPHQLPLIISKNEFLGAQHKSLLRKTRDLFIKKGLCTPEDPTSLVITSFENPDFDIKLAEDRIINNVIFKPFDKLILQQHLAFAIGGRHPVSSYSVHNMKTTAAIEMLKEVEMEALSDVGFVSISNRPIKVGALAKYYSPAFISIQHKSMMALCIRCEPHPDRKDFYRCGFTFLAADTFQITNIRKQVRAKDAVMFDHPWVTSPQTTMLAEIAVITSEDNLGQHFKDSMKKSFGNVEIHHFANLQDFLYTVDPELAKKDKREIDFSKRPHIKNTLHAIVADNTLFEGSFHERWQTILDTVSAKLKKPDTPSGKTEVFMISKRAFSDPEERALGELVRDIFFQPVDPIYLSKKLMTFIPSLQPNEEMKIVTIHQPHVAKAASPIQISEFSEAGLVFKYYRPITTGAFREFVLWLPHELDTPEFLATCNYSEESTTTKGEYFNHFVFFGTTDHYLKYIRRWILQNHVLGKESESA